MTCWHGASRPAICCGCNHLCKITYRVDRHSIIQTNPMALIGIISDEDHAEYHSTAKKWHVVPVMTNICQMKWA